jgi:hypothetical protein
MNTKTNARIALVVAGAALALGGASIHPAGAANSLQCTVGAKKAHSAAVSAHRPFYSPLNPRGLLNAGGKACTAKVAAKKHVQKKHQKPVPKPQKPSVKPAPIPIPVPALPGPVVPLCPLATDDTEGELTVCPPAQPSTDGVSVDQSAQDATDQSAQDATDQSAQDATDQSAQDATDQSAQDTTDQSAPVDPGAGSTDDGGTYS